MVFLMNSSSFSYCSSPISEVWPVLLKIFYIQVWLSSLLKLLIFFLSFSILKSNCARSLSEIVVLSSFCIFMYCSVKISLKSCSEFFKMNFFSMSLVFKNSKVYYLLNSILLIFFNILNPWFQSSLFRIMVWINSLKKVKKKSLFFFVKFAKALSRNYFNCMVKLFESFYSKKL